MRELRCPGGHLHGQTSRRFLRIKCAKCSRFYGHPVYHVWDCETWEIVPEDDDANAANGES
jgi:ribosomal protein S27E